MQDIINSLEQAIKARVETGGYALTVLTGETDFEKVAPCLVIQCASGEETPLGSGNWNALVECALIWPAETEDMTTFRQLCRDVFGLLMADDLAALLSNETDLHIFGIQGRQMESGTSGSMFVSTLKFTCYCCLQDIEAA